MAFWTAVAMAAGLVALQPEQAAPQVAPDPEAAQVDDVEVVARMRADQVRERVNAFIESNMAPPLGRPLARWSKPVCIGTGYLNPQYAQAVIDRIATRIIEAGGDVAEAGCKVDVMVVGTDDGARTARELVKDDPRGYRPSRGSTDRGSAALRRFQEGDAPVRWWHVSLPVNVDTGELAVRLDGEEIPSNTVRDASRLRTNVRDDLARVTVIVDFTRTGHVQSAALVDYIAFIALAQVNPDGDLRGQDTILNLFERPSDYRAMTQWDRDYLAALYRATPNRPSLQAQARGIANEVVRQRKDR
ncbi:hypothetical protein [Brevundimonas naejangsanensis]|jgi:hypothetical protein|uniref:hypothetical protein n=1 Tax=Brevundimonas naejangsanensis TaxID=588932 RepID=UPI003D05B0CC